MSLFKFPAFFHALWICLFVFPAPLKTLDIKKMSFIDFCFVLFLIWIVIFIGLLFYLDGDLSLMWHAKFGRKICKCQIVKQYLKILKKTLFLDELKGQVIWITGASTGIGQSCAIEAAKLGAKLVLSARNEVLLQEVKETCLGKDLAFSLLLS